MPVRPDPSRPGRKLLTDHAGTPLGRFLEGERDGRPTADLFEPEAPAEAVIAQLEGWRITTSEAFGRELVAAGATLARHVHVLTRDLRTEPAAEARPAPHGLLLTPANRPAEDLVGAYRSAFSPDHIDGATRVHEDPREQLDAILTGRLVGPVLDCSGLAVDRDGSVRAAVIVTAAPGPRPFGGPWIAECFRDRDARYAGAGRALLERALVLATRAGLPAMGLAVTHGNRAQSLYAALGFRPALTVFSVDL